MLGTAKRFTRYPSVDFKNTLKLVGLLVAISGCSGDLTTEVTIPNSAIQTGLDAWMPVVLNDYVDKDLPVTATLENAEVVASDGSERLGLTMHLKAVVHRLDANKAIDAVEAEIAQRIPTGFPGPPGGKPPIPEPRKDTSAGNGIVDEIEGTVTARVGIRYDASTAKFYCKDAKAEEINFDKMPAEFEEPIKKLCEETLNRYFAENSVYTLSGDDTTTQFAKSTLKNVTVRDGKLVVEIGVLP